MSLTKSALLADIQEVAAEVSSHDLESSSGGSWINDNGIFPTTIEKAWLEATKSKGVVCKIQFRGSNSMDASLNIVTVDKKSKKKVTTCVMQGKTVSLPDYKMFKQLYAVVTGKVLLIEEVETVIEDVKYKSFGKEVKVKAEVIPALAGKELQIGVRLAAEYAWDKDAGEVDKTEYKTDKNGDPYFQKELESVFSKKGFSAVEVISKAEEPKDIESKRKFLESDKATKLPKLEAKEVEEAEEVEEDSSDELDF